MNSGPDLWNPTIELMPANEMRELQFEKLKKQLVRVYAESPYYRRKFTDAGLDPNKLSSWEQFGDYPFFDKEEERISQEESKAKMKHPFGMHITCDPKKVVRVSSTSGTTGKPTFTGYTQKDREAANEVGARMMWRIGSRPGDVVMHGFVLSMWIAGVPVVDLLQNLGACTVPIGALTGAKRFARIAREVFPVQLNCTPSYAEYLIKKLPEEAGVEAHDLGIKRIMVSGEPGGSIPEVRQRLSQGFGGAEIYDAIGSTHAVFVSSVSCEANAGMHFLADDYCLFELVNPDTLEAIPFEDGAEGEIVLTGLEKECAPAIRWRDKDIVQVFTEPCGCGRPGFRFVVKGRADDMLLVRGVNVYPYAIKDVVTSFHPRATGNIKIVLNEPPPVAKPPLPVKVELREKLPPEAARDLAKEIEDKIHHSLRFRAKVDLVDFGSLESKMGSTHKSQLILKAYE
ncbi:MAG: phenylacetate--CoA ligase [bacterium]|nr:phenylacetate--CoA ligase [bacterium]